MAKSKGRLPDWIERVPGALEVLKGAAGDILDRKGVQELLGLTPRRAQQVIAIAGARATGKGHVVSKEDLAQYLGRYDDLLKAQEKHGRKRFAQTLSKLQEERWEKPQVLVEMPRKQVVELYRKGVKALPDGVELNPGTILIKGESLIDFLRKLASLAVIIGQDQDAFEEKVCPSNSPKGAA